MSQPKKSAAVPRTQDWLNGAERDRLRTLESAIERGARMFVEMGSALAHVRDERLYRENHETFEDYCKQKWGLTRARAYQLMEAAQTAVDLSQKCDTTVNESVARELARSGDPEGTLGKAVERHGPKPTAAQVREVRKPTLAPVPEPDANDDRFTRIEEAVDLLKLLPEPDSIVFPTEGGDVDVVAESLDWLVVWAPKAKAAWKRHQQAQRQAARAVA